MTEKVQIPTMLFFQMALYIMDHEDANDVLQNTFLKAWKSLLEFKGDAKMSTWLYRIAVNESLDFLRKQKHMQTVSADEAPAVAGRLMADEYFDGDKTEALLVEAIETLPDVQRTVFSLRYFEEMKYSEMSKLLDTSEGSLKASYHIAMQKVTDYLKNKM